MNKIALITLTALLSITVQAEVKVTMTTSMGVIKLELDEEKAPVSVQNFIEYAESGFYDGLIFHRVIPGFMIQGGGFNGKLKRANTKAEIINEGKNGLSNLRGTIAMARTNFPHSATSQFYINHKDNPNLDTPASGDRWGYAVFGRVTEGMDVVDQIAMTPTSRVGMHANLPQNPIFIESVTVD